MKKSKLKIKKLEKKLLFCFSFCITKFINQFIITTLTFKNSPLSQKNPMVLNNGVCNYVDTFHLHRIDKLVMLREDYSFCINIKPHMTPVFVLFTRQMEYLGLLFGKQMYNNV